MPFSLRNRVAPVSAGFYLATYWVQGAVDLGMVVLILGAGLAVFIAPESEHSTWPWPDLSIIAFAASLALSVLRSGHVQVSFLMATPCIPAVLIYLLLSRFLVDIRGLWLVLGGVSLGAALIAVVVLVGSFARPIDPTSLIKSLKTTVLLVPNDVLLLSVCVPLILAATSMATHVWHTVVGFFLVALCFAAMVAVNSRSALLAAVIGSVFVLGFRGGRRLWWALAGCAIGLVALDGVRGFSLLTKFLESGMFCNTRLPLWAAAVQLWVEQPLFGYGADSFSALYRQRLEAMVLPACSMIDPRQTPWPHNLFLEMLSSQGILGTTPFVLALGWGVKCSSNVARRGNPANRWLAIGLLGAFAAFGFAALVELTFARYWVVITVSTLMGLAVALNSVTSTSDRIVQ